MNHEKYKPGEKPVFRGNREKPSFQDATEYSLACLWYQLINLADKHRALRRWLRIGEGFLVIWMVAITFCVSLCLWHLFVRG